MPQAPALCSHHSRGTAALHHASVQPALGPVTWSVLLPPLPPSPYIWTQLVQRALFRETGRAAFGTVENELARDKAERVTVPRHFIAGGLGPEGQESKIPQGTLSDLRQNS